MTQEISRIAAALVKAKKAFAPALKNAINPHLKNKYADLGACLDAVDDALLAAGIFMYQETSEDASGVTVETVFLHESGEEVRCGKLHVPAPKQDPQGYGSALTYARRYSLVTACGIAQEDDDGNASAKKPNGTQRAEIKHETKPSLVMATQSDIDEIVAVSNRKQMTAEQKKGLNEWLKDRAGHTADNCRKFMARIEALPDLEPEYPEVLA